MKNYNKHREASVDRYPGKAEFVGRIISGEFKIAVYGLGHVGSLCGGLETGAHVIGVDKSPGVLEDARKGRTNIHEPGVGEAFSKALKEKRFYTYIDPIKASQDSNMKLICVPVL